MRNSGSGILLFADCLKLDRFTKKFVVPWIRFLLMIVAVEPFQKITDQLIPKKCSWKYLCLRFIKYFMLFFFNKPRHRKASIRSLLLLSFDYSVYFYRYD